MQKILLVFLGSGIGGVLRYIISLIFAPTIFNKFPWHTLIANTIAAFLVGLFYAIALQKTWMDKNYLLLLVMGLCGGLSTFSTFSFETIKLWQDQQYVLSIVYVAFSIIICLFFTFIGSRCISSN